MNDFKNEPFDELNKRSVLRRQSIEIQIEYEKIDVLPIPIVKYNVSSAGASSGRYRNLFLSFYEFFGELILKINLT